MRMRLAGKIVLASLPIAVAALLATGYLAWTFLEDANVHDETARAATVASEAMVSLRTLWTEEQLARAAFLEGNESALGNLAAARTELDGALVRLDDNVLAFWSAASLDSVDMANGIAADVEEVQAALVELRSVRQPSSGDLQVYEDASKLLLGIVAQTSLQIDDRSRARELIASEALAQAAFDSFEQEQLVRGFLAGTDQTLEAVEQALTAREVAFGDWLRRAAESSPSAAAMLVNLTIETTQAGRVEVASFPLDRNELLVVAAERLAIQASLGASADANRARTEAIVLGGGAALILLLAGSATITLGRSLVRRVRVVTDAARQVAEVDLPNLVAALRNPDEQIGDAQPARIKAGGSDEVGELARSFSALHGTLVDVARQQMDILRKGVSEIFVTLARRNRELVDRQLALIDQLEAREEDPEVLGGYFKLDHLATRMRRNAESLLVLAGTETKRMWEKPHDIGDVVRAALGEVDDYQRIEVLALEPVQVSGGVVTDLSHLLSELLDNATQFSPPADRVRVTGLFDSDGYLLTISDHGVGMTDDRLGEINRLLAKPPVLGLALDPTLGLYVVARLAARHGIEIRLVRGVPGMTVRVTIPRNKLEVATRSQDDGPGHGEHGAALGESRHVIVARDNGAVATAQRGRVHQRTLSTHDRDTASERPTSPPPLRSVGRGYPSNDTEDPANPLPVQLASNRLSVAPTPPARPETAAPPSLRPAPAPDPRPRTSAGLPARTPGTSFNESPVHSPTSVRSEMSPEGIKDALSAFQGAREIADPDRSSEDLSNVDGRHTDSSARGKPENGTP
jgi:signal transduction histidine kinase